MNKEILTTPMKEEDVRQLRVGDVVYIKGRIFTARDMAHLNIRRLLESGKPLPKDFNGAALFHAGPVCLKNPDGSWRFKRHWPNHQYTHGTICGYGGKIGC